MTFSLPFSYSASLDFAVLRWGSMRMLQHRSRRPWRLVLDEWHAFSWFCFCVSSCIPCVAAMPRWPTFLEVKILSSGVVEKGTRLYWTPTWRESWITWLDQTSPSDSSCIFLRRNNIDQTRIIYCRLRSLEVLQTGRRRLDSMVWIYSMVWIHEVTLKSRPWMWISSHAYDPSQSLHVKVNDRIKIIHSQGRFL